MKARSLPRWTLVLFAALTPGLGWSQNGPLEGSKTIWLHPRQGERVDVGRVVFKPKAAGEVSFHVTMNHANLKDHFLSMREFKCAEGRGEVLCHVPYPYSQPYTVKPHDVAWLEHALMFMFKLPSEFGAKLWNGIYFQLKHDGQRWVGTPQAVDLNLIGAPPAKLDVPPYPATRRDAIREGTRWFHQLSIE